MLHQVIEIRSSQFTLPFYSVSFILDTLGLFLFDIDANDCDSGKNSEIQFSVTGGNNAHCN